MQQMPIFTNMMKYHLMEANRMANERMILATVSHYAKLETKVFSHFMEKEKNVQAEQEHGLKS